MILSGPVPRTAHRLALCGLALLGLLFLGGCMATEVKVNGTFTTEFVRRAHVTPESGAMSLAGPAAGARFPLC